MLTKVLLCAFALTAGSTWAAADAMAAVKAQHEACMKKCHDEKGKHCSKKCRKETKAARKAAKAAH